MPTLPDDVRDALTARLGAVDDALTARFPGEPGTRQPVHTCYVPADRVTPGLVPEWGQLALAALDAHAPDASSLAAATGHDPAAPPRTVTAVAEHVRRVLAAEPVQDLRVDLEDGYGVRDDATEDHDAVASARALLTAAAVGTLPSCYGLRPKSMDAAVRRRGLRSLDLFLTTLAEGPGGPPPGLVVTLPKVSAAVQVIVFVEVLSELERQLGIPATPIEIQVETPAAVMALPDLVAAGRPRLAGLHVGTYDYSAALGVSAEHQASDHPAVELATALMQLTAAGTGVRVADGSSNLLPVGEGATVRAAWERHANLVRRAWSRGLYQGWDLHPAQLVSRHAAVAGCLLGGLSAALARLAAYARAQACGSIADEPATARALAGHVLRALDAELVDDAGLAAAGLDRATVRQLGGRLGVPPAWATATGSGTASGPAAQLPR